MNASDLKEKLAELQQDPEFLKYLFAQDTPEKIQSAFSEKGITLSLDEVKAIVKNTVDSLEGDTATEELNEAQLEAVAGGFAITALVGWACMAALAGSGIVIGWKLAKGKC